MHEHENIKQKAKACKTDTRKEVGGGLEREKQAYFQLGDHRKLVGGGGAGIERVEAGVGGWGVVLIHTHRSGRAVG